MQKEFEIEDGVLLEYHGSEAHVIVPDGVLEIGEGAFDGCSDLESVVLPDSVELIGIGAFGECEKLKQITIPDGVTQIEEMAFYGCRSLRSVTLPRGLTVIERRAFYECESLTSIIIPDGVTEIKRFAFSECAGLRAVILPDSVTQIEEFAFMYTPGITFVCGEGSFAQQYCTENQYRYIFDYQYAAFHGLIPQGFEKLSSPFLADEEKPYLFISYSHKDRDEVLPVIRDLYEDGWKIWYDEGLTIGDRYDETLEQHVRNCAAFLLFVSPNSLRSFYCRENEIPWAVSSGRPIIKCILGGEAEDDIREDMVIATVSPQEIGAALAGVDGLIRGEKRTARGISVIVAPADRDERERSTSFACCLYSGGGKGTARTIMLEARNSGCSLYDGTETADEEKRAESACLIVFLDKAFLADAHLTGILIEAFQEKRDIAVCQLEDIGDADLPPQLLGLHKMQWLNYAHGISADMNTKLARHLQIRGCRSRSILPGFDYEIKEGRIILRRYTGFDPKPRIESKYGGIPVTEIADGAFRGCAHLQAIDIPDSVKEIGEGAFEECVSLTGVRLPQALSVIRDSTFAQCRSLTAISIPGRVTQIGSGVFQGCRRLASIVIPESVTQLGSSVFSGCVSLRSADIPESVTQIGGMSFEGCKELGALILPHRLNAIDAQMFYGCTSLTDITIPENVIEIGWLAFKGCRLSKVVIPGNVRVIGERAFSEIETLTSVTICRGVRAIGYGAFYQCRSLKQADIPGSVVFIDEGAFADCPDLTITCREYTEAWEYCKRENVAFVLSD